MKSAGEGMNATALRTKTESALAGPSKCSLQRARGGESELEERKVLEKRVEGRTGRNEFTII